MSGARTISESIFENFLRDHDLPFERIKEADAPRPDYLVTVGALHLIFEVKELARDDDFRVGQFASSSRKVGDHIRSKIREASKQIRFGSNRGIPSILLVYNAIDRLHLFGTEDHDFIDAMYGERTLKLGLESGRMLDEFHGRNRSFSDDLIRGKTHFSALGRLAPYRGQLTVTLFENTFAAVPIPHEVILPFFKVIRFTVEGVQ